MHFVLLFVLSLFLGGCSARYSDFFPYYDNGTKKPFLTMLPTFNASMVSGSDTISGPLTKQVRNRLKRKGKVYCPPEEMVERLLQTVSLQELTSAKDLELFTKFKGIDYVCSMELAEYKIVPYKRNTISPLYLASIPEDLAKVLQISVRLQIIDVRTNNPKFVRQELVQSNHMIPQNIKEVKIEMIRSRLARDLAEKIEQTVCVKK